MGLWSYGYASEVGGGVFIPQPCLSPCWGRGLLQGCCKAAASRHLGLVPVRSPVGSDTSSARPHPPNIAISLTRQARVGEGSAGSRHLFSSLSALRALASWASPWLKL